MLLYGLLCPYFLIIICHVRCCSVTLKENILYNIKITFHFESNRKSAKFDKKSATFSLSSVNTKLRMADDEQIVTVTRTSGSTLRTRRALVVIMYLEWIVMALLIGLVFVRLVYSTDRNWLYFVLLLLLAVFLLVPVLITISCLQETMEQPQQLQEDTPIAKPRRRNASVKSVRRSSKPVKEEDTESKLDFIVKKEIPAEQKDAAKPKRSPRAKKAPKEEVSVESEAKKENRKVHEDTEPNLDLTVKKEIPTEKKEAAKLKSSAKANQPPQEEGSAESKAKKNPKKSSQAKPSTVKTTPSQDKNKPDDSDGKLKVCIQEIQ